MMIQSEVIPWPWLAPARFEGRRFALTPHFVSFTGG
jgi:hypothetical protein